MRLRTSPVVLATLLLLAFAHGGEGPRPEADDLLTAIDFVPARTDLDQAMGPAPIDELIALIENETADPGVRLRAVRALAQYPGDEARAEVIETVTDPPGSDPQVDFVLQRAALETLGEIGRPDEDWDLIAAYLYVENAPHQDTRAAAAHALRVLGSPLARRDLEQRRDEEQVPQVVVAIIEALRALLSNP